MIYEVKVWEIYIWGIGGLSFFGGVLENEEEPIIFGAYAKMAEVGNGAVR